MNACRGSKSDIECARKCAQDSAATIQVQKWLLLKWRESQLQYEEDEVSLDFDGTVPGEPIGYPIGYPGEEGFGGVIYVTPKLSVETDPVTHITLEFDDPLNLASGAVFAYDVGEPRVGTVDSAEHTVSSCPPEGATTLKQVSVDLCGLGNHQQSTFRRRDAPADEGRELPENRSVKLPEEWILETIDEEATEPDEVVGSLVEHPEFRSRVNEVIERRRRESGDLPG
jgi:hypothetical protein